MFWTYSPFASSFVTMKVIRAPVATAGNVESTKTFRKVPLGLKDFVGLTQVAVSTTIAPCCFLAIFRSSQVCNSILY